MKKVCWDPAEVLLLEATWNSDNTFQSFQGLDLQNIPDYLKLEQERTWFQM